MITLKDQVKTLAPSVKNALYRRLIREDELGFLRDDDATHIIGFEVDLERSDPLLGYTIIAISKHTLLAYKTDLGEDLRLVIFPSMDKLFDPEFGLRDLYVKKTLFTDDTFIGKVLEEGLLGAVVADLTPPQRKIELPSGVTEAMVAAMHEESARLNTEARKVMQIETDTSGDEPKKIFRIKKAIDVEIEKAGNPIVEDDNQLVYDGEPITEYEDVDYDEFYDEEIYDYDDYPTEYVEGDGVDDVVDDTPVYESSPDIIKERDPRSLKLLEQTFTDMASVSNYAIMLGVPSPIVNQLVARVINKEHDRERQILMVTELICMVFDQHMYGL